MTSINGVNYGKIMAWSNQFYDTSFESYNDTDDDFWRKKVHRGYDVTPINRVKYGKITISSNQTFDNSIYMTIFDVKKDFHLRYDIITPN